MKTIRIKYTVLFLIIAMMSMSCARQITGVAIDSAIEETNWDYGCDSYYSNGLLNDYSHHDDVSLPVSIGLEILDIALWSIWDW